ncbi:MAG: DNA polymerase I [Synergistaceae bacterium]|jgi:DNA polymerase-1|nr:DNA polymerase I [Synergistaceae bacterium]
MESGSKRSKILIVDGHGLAFRAFYAVPPLSAPDGTPTNAILGFMNMLTKVEDEVAPDRCVVVFDAPGPTFRHEIFPDYKAQRKPAPEEFRPQVPLLRELLTALGYPVIVREGVEADDVIASLAKKAAAEEKEAVVVSSDKDLLQILSPGIRMLRPIRGITTLKDCDEAAFIGEFGFEPVFMADYLALLGDAADNVPGVPGIGEKTALQLIREYRTLERLYDALTEEETDGPLKTGVRKKLEAGRASAFYSRDLIYLKTDLPLDPADLPDNPARGRREDALRLCERLGMTRFAEKLKHAVTPVEADAPEAKSDAPVPAGSVPVEFEDLLDAEGLAAVLFHTGKYPPEAESAEVQIADEHGRYAVRQGPELRAGFWERLRGKKLYVNDYKELAACFGPETFQDCEIWDLKTAHYLLHPDRPSHGLKDLYPDMEEKAGVPTGLLWCAARHLGLDLRRYEGLSELMRDVDLPLIPVLVEMERKGVSLSSPLFISLQQELEERVASIEEEIALRAGAEINLNSPKQVAWLLFEKLELPGGAKTKGKTALSTSASVLEGLAALELPHSDVPRLMLEHRELTKMLSGFVVPLQKAAAPCGGVVHTTFEAAFTGTGRLSSRDPNLQNLPAFGNWSRRLKEGLIPSAPDRIFVAADYSQVELRILAHLSGEERLRDAFRNGRDIHRETASWVFSTPPEDVTPELRRVAKMINFGLLYGMSAFGLAGRLGIARGEASSIISRYFAALPGVRNYLDESAAEAQKRGYTRTLFGRVRPIDEAAEGLRDRNALRRVAINTPIQGTAADIARRAMIDFNRIFPADGDVRLFLQIHDSLICECPKSLADQVGETLCGVMKSAASLSIPLDVELKKGRSLADV